MIRLRPIALLVLLTVLRLKAATVTGLVQNITLEAPTNAPMVFAPTANPSYDNGRLTTDTAKGVRVGSNGSFRADLAAGEYLLTIGTSTKRVKFTVPPGTETYDLMVLVTNTPFSTNIPGSPFELKAKKGVANGYVPLDALSKIPTNYLPAETWASLSNLQWQIDQLIAGGTVTTTTTDDDTGSLIYDDSTGSDLLDNGS